MDSQEYDEYKATIRAPKGARLSSSRKTAGAHRGFAHDPEAKTLRHAEIFLKDESLEESIEYYSPPPFTYIDYDLTPNSKEEDLPDARAVLGFLVLLAAIKATEKAAPHIRRWWINRASPAIRSAWERLAKSRKADGDAVDTARNFPQAAIASSDENQISMSSVEAMERFVAALTARLLSEDAKRFSEEQIEVLRNARIENLELPDSSGMLTPEEVRDGIKLMLEQNPSLLDDVRKLVGEGRADVRQAALPDKVIKVAQPPGVSG
ncbi:MULTISPECIES: hypothetical protein [unclassified Micromonospora]|uniref:hypothetical protein n=1 Tax=unclassified Micromonospora TaxID=2617518 RepID=UPI003A8C5D1E